MKSDIVIKIPQATRQGWVGCKIGGIFDWSYPNSKHRRGRVQGDQGDICPSLTSSTTELYFIEKVDINVLTRKRTSYGKAVRKQYESGKLKDKWNKMSTLVPKDDGISNTITTVLKDNLLYEPISCAIRGRKNKSGKYIQELEKGDNVSNCLTSVHKDNLLLENHKNMEQEYLHDKVVEVVQKEQPLEKPKRKFRIRKLTPKECFRLMGVGEDDIETLLHAGISNSQLYKMAGNSIVVDVLDNIFEQLFYPDDEVLVLLP